MENLSKLNFNIPLRQNEIDIKDEKDLKGSLSLEFHESEQKVLEMLDQNVTDCKDNIKIGKEYSYTQLVFLIQLIVTNTLGMSS